MESDVTDGQVSKIDFSETYDKDTDSSVIGDPKDLIIKSLQEEKESLILEIKALKLEWAREKDLNNVLLEERRLRQQLENTTNNTVPTEKTGEPAIASQESPMLTPAQRIRSPVNTSVIVSDDEDPNAKSQTVLSDHDLSLLENLDHSEASGMDSGSPGVEGDSKLNSSSEGGVLPAKELAPLHSRDFGPAKYMSYILNRLKNVPDYRSTLMVGDSNFHGVNQGEIDPTDRSVAIRSISGLCVVSAGHALKNYEHQYPKFRKVVFAIGTNDYLHRVDHCEGDWHTHLVDLVSNIKRVFPRAELHFIMPYSGLPELPYEFVQSMEKAIKEVCPRIKRHRAPSMKGMVRRDGVHLNYNGTDALRNFLIKTFTRHQPDANDDSHVGRDLPRRPSDRYHSYSEAAQSNMMSNRSHLPATPIVDPNARMGQSSLPRYSVPNYSAPPVNHHHYNQKDAMIRDVTEALASMLCSYMQNKPSV